MEAFDPEFAANPQPGYRELRERCPVAPEDFGATLYGRREVETALRDTEAFTSNWGEGGLGNVRPLIPLQIDPPEHLKYRKLLDPLFAPRPMTAMEPEVERLVDDLIDTFIERGECDFTEAFAIPLPSAVFLRLLGLPLEDLTLFLRLKDGIIRPAGETPEAQDAERNATGQELYSYFDGVLDERESDRRDDLLSRLLDAEVDGHRLTREDILDICFLFFIAGLDTVTDALTCDVAFLAQHPEHRRRLVQDPALIPSAIEELLRWETPVATVVRFAKTDTEIGGCPIKTGQMVSVCLGSANLDPVEFDDPFDVNFGRNPNRHMGFGGGIHRCLGSHLARMELRVALRQLHARIPDYEIKPGSQLTYTPALRCVEHLELVFPAGKRR
ncbi:MAG: cytochrome P450 [Acidimicrobiales bacterium]